MNKRQTTSFWTNQTIQVTGEGPDGPFVSSLNKPFGLIGAHPEADVVLVGDEVARRHLYLHVADGGIFVVDLAAGRGQTKNLGKWIGPDETWSVGQYVLTFGLAGSKRKGEIPKLNLLAGRSSHRPFPSMTCTSDAGQLGRHNLRRRLSIVGRDIACTFQFTTRSISPEHCVLYQQRGRIWVIDLKSLNKTLVRGRAVECAKLKHNSQIAMGRVKIRFKTTKQTSPVDERISDSSESVSDLNIGCLTDQRQALSQQLRSLEQQNAGLASRQERLSVAQKELQQQRDVLNREQNDLGQRGQILDQRATSIDNQRTSLDKREKQLKITEQELDQQWSSLGREQTIVKRQQKELDQATAEMDRKQSVFESQKRLWQETLEQQKQELEDEHTVLAHRESRLSEAIRDETEPAPGDGNASLSSRSDLDRDAEFTRFRQLTHTEHPADHPTELTQRDREIQELSGRLKRSPATRDRLERDRIESGRFDNMDVTQQQVINNLTQLEREKSSFDRLLGWILRR